MQDINAFIHLAENIKKSGRWKEHNVKIETLANKNNGDEWWYLYVFSQLTYQMFDEYNKLTKAYEEKDISEIAWRSRNLLEIMIWSIYCSQSGENAKRFFGDGGRDANDLLNKLSNWEKYDKQDLNWAPHIDKSRIALKEFSDEVNVGSIEDKHTLIHTAAKQINFQNEYETTNKMLSKFIHPTAFKIIGYLKEDKIEELQKGFYAQGCGHFGAAFEYLEKQIQSMTTNF
jgi:hypothetical protein